MYPDGNRLQNRCSPRHWGHSTMHRVPPVSGTTTTIYICVYTYTYTLAYTHTNTYYSSCQTVGKWHEMHGQMPLSHGLTAIVCSLLRAYPP